MSQLSDVKSSSANVVRKKRVMMNWKFLAFLLAILVPVSAFVVWRYRVQSRQAAEVFYEQSKQQIAEEKWEEAADSLFRYVQFRPDNTGALCDLATVYGKMASTRKQKERAVELHFRAVGLSKGIRRVELNRRLAELLLDLERYDAAYDEAVQTNAYHQAEFGGQSDPAADRIVAIAQYYRHRVDPSRKEEATDGLYDVVKSRPVDVELVSLAARACRELDGNGHRADALMEDLVSYTENQEKTAAWLARHEYHREFVPDLAEADLERALRYATEDPDDILSAGVAALSWYHRPGVESKAKWLAASIAKLEELFADGQQPSNALAYLSLGSAYLQDDDPERAVKIWREGVERLSADSFDLRVQLCRLYIRQGRVDLASDEFLKLKDLVREIISRSEESFGDLVSLENKVDLLECEIQLASGHTGRAIRRINTLVTTMPIALYNSDFNVRYNALMLLGNAYASDQNFHAAAQAFGQASLMDLDAGEAALRAAEAYLSTGDDALAAKTIERNAKELNNADMWFSAAEFLLRLALRKPESDPARWTDFEEAIAQGRAIRPDSWQASILEATQQILKRNVDGALQHLAAAEELEPATGEFWQRLALLYQDLGRPDDTDRVLERFKELEFESRPWRPLMTEARVLARRGRTKEAIVVARDALEQSSPGERRTIEELLVELHQQAGDGQAARQLLLAIHKRQPNDLSVLRELADIDLANENFDGVRNWERELKAQEGDESGWLWRYYRARRLLAEPKRVSDSKTPEELAKSIEELRPGWAEGMILWGDIFALKGEYETAVEYYSRAINQVDRLDVYERLIAALFQAGRFGEAMDIVKKLQHSIPNSDRLSLLSSAVAKRANQVPQALETARQTLDQRPDDPAAFVWLAQLLILNGQDVEAEKTLRAAVAAAEDNFGTGFALFSFYATRNPDLAKQVLLRLEAQDSPDIGPRERKMILGQCWQQIGDDEAAQRLFQSVIDEDPANENARLLMARLHFNSDPAAAEKQLREVLRLNEQSAPARRMLATLLAIGGGAQQWQEVESLLSSATDLVDDARLRAILLTRRGGRENLAKARDVLAALVASSDAIQATDRMLLANAYESEGDIENAKVQYEFLCNVVPPEPMHLAGMVAFLVRNGRAAEADVWIDKLDEVLPARELSRLLFLETKARWLSAVDRVSEIEPMLEGFAKQIEKDQDKLALYESIGQIYTSVQLHAPAERWFRRLNVASPKQYRELAICLAHLGKHEEAVRLALSNHSNDTDLRLLECLVDILSAGTPDASVWELTEPIWQKAESDTRLLAPPLFASAARAIAGRSDEAMQITRELHRRNPHNVLVMNNLATLLGQAEGHQAEALALVNKAIERAGEQPFLLDTKSLILVEMDKPEEAVDTLRHLVAIARPDPRILFRLAVAHMRSGSNSQARSMLLRALDSGLESRVLTGHDMDLLDELKGLAEQAVQ